MTRQNERSTRINVPSPKATGGNLGGTTFKVGERHGKRAPCRDEARSEPYSGAAGSLKRLGRIDVEESAVAFDRDLRHRLTMFRDQVASADVAVERHQFVEEAPRPQHWVAAP